MCKVTVVMPAYNCASTIEAAIESVLIQDVPLRLIVINDCSKDHLDEIMRKYQDNPRILYVKNEKNMGAAASRNKAVAMADTEYVAFLDSDDIWMAGKLKKQLECLEKTGFVLCSTGRQLMSVDGTLSKKYIGVPKHITYKKLQMHNCINCSSVLIKTQVAKEFPMMHEDSHEDYITWLKILRKYENAVGIDEPLLWYRLSSTGKSGSKLKSAKMTWKAYRYMGYGWLKSCVCFCCYVVNGIMKYL